jgi:hypothetical protein
LRYSLGIDLGAMVINIALFSKNKGKAKESFVKRQKSHKFGAIPAFQ